MSPDTGWPGSAPSSADAHAELRADLLTRLRLAPAPLARRLDRLMSEEDGPWKGALLVRAMIGARELEECDRAVDPVRAIARTEIGRIVARALPVKWLLLEGALRNRSASLRAAGETPAEPMLLDVLADLAFAEASSAGIGGAGLDADAGDPGDPFVFMRHLPHPELVELLEGVAPARVALISSYWLRGELAPVMQAMPEPARKLALLEYARIAGAGGAGGHGGGAVSKQVTRHAARRLAVELRARQERLARDRDRARANAWFAARLPVVGGELERQLLSFVQQGQSSGLAYHRYFCFDRLTDVAAELLRAAMLKMELEEIAGALIGASAAVASHLLAALPDEPRDEVRAHGRRLRTDDRGARDRSWAYRQLLLGRVLEQLEEQGTSWEEIAVTGRELAPYPVRLLGQVDGPLSGAIDAGD